MLHNTGIANSVSEHLQYIPIDGDKGRDVLSNVSQAYLKPDATVSVTPYQVALIDNPELQEEYEDIAKSWKQKGYSGAELKERQCFSLVSPTEVESISKKGWCTHSDRHKKLKRPTFGVAVHRYADVALSMDRTTDCTDLCLMVFKVVFGKRCTVSSNQIYYHGSPVLSPSSSLNSQISQDGQKVYLYDPQCHRLRHCLPYAVVYYKKRATSDQDYPSICPARQVPTRSSVKVDMKTTSGLDFPVVTNETFIGSSLFHYDTHDVKDGGLGNVNQTLGNVCTVKENMLQSNDLTTSDKNSKAEENRYEVSESPSKSCNTVECKFSESPAAVCELSNVSVAPLRQSVQTNHVKKERKKRPFKSLSDRFNILSATLKTSGGEVEDKVLTELSKLKTSMSNKVTHLNLARGDLLGSGMYRDAGSYDLTSPEHYPASSHSEDRIGRALIQTEVKDSGHKQVVAVSKDGREETFIAKAEMTNAKEGQMSCNNKGTQYKRTANCLVSFDNNALPSDGKKQCIRSCSVDQQPAQIDNHQTVPRCGVDSLTRKTITPKEGRSTIQEKDDLEKAKRDGWRGQPYTRRSDNMDKPQNTSPVDIRDFGLAAKYAGKHVRNVSRSQYKYSRYRTSHRTLKLTGIDADAVSSKEMDSLTEIEKSLYSRGSTNTSHDAYSCQAGPVTTSAYGQHQSGASQPYSVQMTMHLSKKAQGHSGHSNYAGADVDLSANCYYPGDQRKTTTESGVSAEESAQIDSAVQQSPGRRSVSVCVPSVSITTPYEADSSSNLADLSNQGSAGQQFTEAQPEVMGVPQEYPDDVVQQCFALLRQVCDKAVSDGDKLAVHRTMELLVHHQLKQLCTNVKETVNREEGSNKTSCQVESSEWLASKISCLNPVSSGGKETSSPDSEPSVGRTKAGKQFTGGEDTIAKERKKRKTAPETIGIFHGRTLLRGGVEPRAIPLSVLPPEKCRFIPTDPRQDLPKYASHMKALKEPRLGKLLKLNSQNTEMETIHKSKQSPQVIDKLNVSAQTMFMELETSIDLVQTPGSPGSDQEALYRDHFVKHGTLLKTVLANQSV